MNADTTDGICVHSCLSAVRVLGLSIHGNALLSHLAGILGVRFLRYETSFRSALSLSSGIISSAVS